MDTTMDATINKTTAEFANVHNCNRRNTINNVGYIKSELIDGLTLTCEDRDGYYYSDDGINISYSG